MIDWNTETTWRCSCCNDVWESCGVAVKCHAAPLIAIIECSLCGQPHEAENARTARRSAEQCCQEPKL